MDAESRVIVHPASVNTMTIRSDRDQDRAGGFVGAEEFANLGLASGVYESEKRPRRRRADLRSAPIAAANSPGRLPPAAGQPTPAGVAAVVAPCLLTALMLATCKRSARLALCSIPGRASAAAPARVSCAPDENRAPRRGWQDFCSPLGSRKPRDATTRVARPCAATGGSRRQSSAGDRTGDWLRGIALVRGAAIVTIEAARHRSRPVRCRSDHKSSRAPAKV